MIEIWEEGVVVEEKGFVRVTENSPEGGGAMERGIFALVKCGAWSGLERAGCCICCRQVEVLL